MTYTWTQDDYEALAQLSAAQSPPIDPVQVALVLFEESGLNPASPGPAGANPPVGGLNQMSTDNLTNLGVTRAAWLAMTAAEQLPIIFKWWNSLANSDNSGNFPADGGTLLALNFLPGSFRSVGAGSNPNAAVAGAAGPYASYYNSNISLDPQRTGVITPATCELRLQNVAAAAGAKWTAIAQNIDAVSLYSGGISSNAKRAIIALAGGLALGGAAFWASENKPVFNRIRRRVFA